MEDNVEKNSQRAKKGKQTQKEERGVKGNTGKYETKCYAYNWDTRMRRRRSRNRKPV